MRVERCEPLHGSRLGKPGHARRRWRQVGYGRAADDGTCLIELQITVDRHEEMARAVGRLRRAEHEVAAWPQGEMANLDHAILGGPIQVDQQIAARHEIEVRKRRVANDVVVREQDQLAQLAPDPVAADLAMKKSLEPGVRKVGNFGTAIASLACPRHRLLVEIRSKYLH